MNLSELREAATELRARAVDEAPPGYYLMEMHPQNYHDLRCALARDAWKDAYRAARLLGMGRYPAREIARRYTRWGP